jgi:toxin YoeB
VYTKQAKKDAKKLKAAGLKPKAQNLLALLENDPYSKDLSVKKLVGDLEGTYSIRINKQHRIVYQLYEEEKVIKVIRMWTHYE